MQSDLTSIFLPSARWLSSSDLYTLAAHACQSAQTFLLSTAYATQMHQHAETIVKIMNCDRGLLLPVFHPTFRHMTCTCVSEHGHATKEASASRALSCSQTRRARTCCDVSSAAPGPGPGWHDGMIMKCTRPCSRSCGRRTLSYHLSAPGSWQKPGAVRCHYEMTGGFVVGASFRDQIARTARRSDLPFHTRFRAAIPFLLSADGMALRGAVCCLLLALEVFSTRVDARRGLTQGAPTLSGHALLGSDIQCVRASGRVRPARWPRGAGEPRCDVQRCTSQRRCLGPADQRSSSAAGGGVLW